MLQAVDEIPWTFCRVYFLLGGVAYLKLKI
jgi:hypothetical protein